MANFILLYDPDPRRRASFLSVAEKHLPLMDGLVVSRLEVGNVALAWAAGERAPINHSILEDGGAIIFGDAIGRSGVVSPVELRQKWSVSERAHQTPLDGFHAAIVLDRDCQEVVVGADLLGIFPIYYYAADEVLLVGSSVALFRYHPLFRQAIDVRGVTALLLINSIFDGRTLLEGVRRLAPGHLLSWQPGCLPREECQYQVPSTTVYYDYSFADHLELIHELLTAAVERHLVGDRQVGLLLSGGLDSRMVAGYLKRAGIAAEALTLGVRGDLEMSLATRVARATKMPQRRVTVNEELYPEYARMEAEWAQCANGFNNIWGWGVSPHLATLPRRTANGFILDCTIGGVFPKQYGQKASFVTVFKQLNEWGFPPDTVAVLLAERSFPDAIETTIRRMCEVYEAYSDVESKRAFLFKLYHRQRFHVGGVIWQFSFGSWPVNLATDRALLDAVGGMPPAALSERRAQKDLLRRKFPYLARIPLDTNSYSPEILEPQFGDLLQRRMSAWLRPMRDAIWSAMPRIDRERRIYYRLYDFNGVGWSAVRKDAYRLKSRVSWLLESNILDDLLGDATTQLSFSGGITNASASGRKTLVGLLLLSEGSDQPSLMYRSGVPGHEVA